MRRHWTGISTTWKSLVSIDFRADRSRHSPATYTRKASSWKYKLYFGELPAPNVGFGAAGNAMGFGGDVHYFWDLSIGGVGDALWLYDVFKDLGALRTFVACSWN